MEWESVIGLEVHVQLATASKLFSGARNQFGDTPNQNACPIDLGFPGTLPVVNQQAVHMAIKLGVALQAQIATTCTFDRKNYFYPDLPKGYQVTQAARPIFTGGQVVFVLDEQEFTIHLHHAHMEEDAGKSIHGVIPGHSGIDLNRAGTPLLEIVTEPDFRSAREASQFLRTVHNLVQYLEISDGNMAEGSLRCDANVSVRPKGQAEYGTRTEIKNLNSFRFIEQAIDHEIARHIDVLEAGGALIQETRLYDPDRNETRSMRSKEDANDYRYFPEPDLLPVIIDPALIEDIRHNLPELEDVKKQRYMQSLALSAYDANQLTSDLAITRYFENVIALTGIDGAKTAANWILTELLGALNKRELSWSNNPILPEQLAQLIARINEDIISNKIAKSIFETLCEQPSKDQNAVDTIISQRGLQQVSDTGELQQLIDTVLEEHSAQVSAYIQAPPEKQQKMTGFFIGQLMKKTKGQGNPKVLNELLRETLAQMAQNARSGEGF